MSKKSKYSYVKDIFIDSVDNSNFIELDTILLNYKILEDSLGGTIEDDTTIWETRYGEEYDFK